MFNAVANSMVIIMQKGGQMFSINTGAHSRSSTRLAHFEQQHHNKIIIISINKENRLSLSLSLAELSMLYLNKICNLFILSLISLMPKLPYEANCHFLVKIDRSHLLNRSYCFMDIFAFRHTCITFVTFGLSVYCLGEVFVIFVKPLYFEIINHNRL